MNIKSRIKGLVKPKTIIVDELDKFLIRKGNRSAEDRAQDVNAPSQAGNCLRRNYFARMGALCDGSVDPRTQRVFDNGTKTHERLQEYLIEMELLLQDEVPIRCDELNIQGHTDGLLNIKSVKDKLIEIGVLEIKSINSRQFSTLKDAREHHKKQAMVYLYCLESRRKYLINKYSSLEEFEEDYDNRLKYYESLYQHLKSGRKYTREQKMRLQTDLHDMCDTFLMHVQKPLTKVIFLYENKDTQELKEFVVDMDKELLNEVLEGYKVLNKCIKDGVIPDREGSSKTCEECRWCNYKIECWN